MFSSPFFIRLFHWEYWSFGMVYTWIYPVWLFLCVRARSFFFFSAANPSIKNGGFLNESKKDICALIPEQVHPPSVFFSVGETPEFVVREVKAKPFRYPLIGKPDIGGRGRGIKLLHNDEDVKNYAMNSLVDFHIQPFISFANEVGIFYYRIPGEAKGKLSGIVHKEFLTVTGNGRKTIRELLEADPRCILQLRSLEKMYGSGLQEVLASGEKKELVPYGNHARGAKFLDHSHLIDEQLSDMIDGVCRQVKDFYFGRLDIRYNDWEELKQGKNFCVIEVNGAGSEPTHIYDPRHSLMFAWKEIIRHWIILWRISRRNHSRGYRYLSFKEGVKMFYEDRENSRRLAAMPE